MDDQTIEGGCLCGRVRFRVRGPFERFYYCHCSHCRKASGSAHAANLFSTPERLEWLAGEALVKRFDLMSAERFARCFCSECGSPVPWASRDGSYLIVPAGALDSDPAIRPGANIFWRDRAAWEEPGRAAPCYDAYPTD